MTTINEISQLYRNHRDEVNDEKLRRMMLAMEDVKSVLVKLACRVHNMKTIRYLAPEKQRLFAQETLDIFAVVANRLGCWCLKVRTMENEGVIGGGRGAAREGLLRCPMCRPLQGLNHGPSPPPQAELEDLAFAVLNPEEHARVAAMVSSRQDPVALEATVQAVKAGMEAKGIKYEDISGRPKNLYGIWQKMLKDGVTNVDKVSIGLDQAFPQRSLIEDSLIDPCGGYKF